MKVLLIALLLSLFTCRGGEAPAGCSKLATVTDFTGLDGCGLMLVLEDGTRLIPEKRTYIQAPKQEDDPLYYFTLTAGQQVKIAYNETNTPNVCMAGKTVFITCITKIE